MPYEIYAFRLTEIIVDTRRRQIELHVGALVESETGGVQRIADLIVIANCRQTGKYATRDQWIDVQSLAAEHIKLARITVVVDVSEDTLPG